MKKWKSYLVLAGLLLTGCSRLEMLTTSSTTSTENSSQTTVTSTATTSQETSSQVVTGEELYAKVLEDYRIFLAKAPVTGSGTYDTQALLAAVNSMSIPIHDWTGANLASDRSAFRYAFHDIDGNGTPEFLVGIKSTTGHMVLNGLYYIADNSPKLLAEAFVGSSAARAGIVIYNDGTIASSGWSSGTGEGSSTLFALQADDSPAQEVQKVSDIRINIDNLNAAFGKSMNQILGLESLTWQELSSHAARTVESQSTSSEEGADLNALRTGDFSSIQGTWRNSKGDGFTISGGTMTFSRDGKTYTMTVPKDGETGLWWTLAEARTSPPVYIIYPVGRSIIKYPDGIYISDESRDRIFLQPQYMAPQEEIEGAIYYKE